MLNLETQSPLGLFVELWWIENRLSTILCHSSPNSLPTFSSQKSLRCVLESLLCALLSRLTLLSVHDHRSQHA
jgi:hypothetical protein